MNATKAKSPVKAAMDKADEALSEKVHEALEQEMQPEVSELDQVLTDRRQTHGTFEDHAACSQQLKLVLRAHISARQMRGQPPLKATQIESFEMILHKIARAVAGDPDFEDHYVDIAGYSNIANGVRSKDEEKEDAK